MALSYTRHVAGEDISETHVNELQVGLEELSAQTDTLDTTVGGHTTSIGSLNTQVAAHDAAIDTLTTDVEGHAALIDRLQDNVLRRSPLQNFALGVATHVDWGQSIATFNSELDRHQADGVRVVRSDISWRAIETAKGTYDATALSKYDNAALETYRRGEVLIFTIFEIGQWANGTTDWYASPTNYSDMYDFCLYIANRYRAYNHIVWELWNEPSFFGVSPDKHWWNPFGRPCPLGGNYPAKGGVYGDNETTAANAYADMCYYMYTAIKAVAPHHFVLGGCPHLNDPAFITKIYQRLAASWASQRVWDGVSIHPYCSNKDPYDTGTSNASFLLGITDTRGVMNTYRDGGPIWITEWGYNTASGAGSPMPGADDAARDVTRGDYFERAMDIVRQYPYVECLCVFTPSPVETVDTPYDFSLYKAGANLASYNRILAKGRSMQGGRVAATAAVSASGYSAGNANWWPVVFKGVDVEDTNNMHFTSDVNISGTVKRTNASATLAGTGTAFKTDLAVGQVILIGSSGATTHVVTAIASDTSCTISPVYTGTSDGAGVTAQRRADYLVAPYTGAYTVVGWFQVPANATGIRMARLNVNGTALMTQGPVTGNATYPTGFAFSASLNLKQWDRVSMDVYQDSGTAQTIPAATAGLSLVRSAPLPW